jgi:hypothetical protein
MTETITYALRNSQKHSDQYYQDVSAFTDKVLVEAESRIQTLVGAFETYLQQTGRETPRTLPEYAFEFLTLGVLWRIYAGTALDLAKIPQRTLVYLVGLRQKGERFKPGIDFLRGLVGRLFLSTNGRHPAKSPQPTLEHLDRLLDWLSTTDTFSQEIKRLRLWRDFLADQSPGQARENLETAFAFATWFENKAETALGCYTPHVEQFLAETHPGYRWREDAVFCGRQRVEYHLNMVGTEILNRAFRDAFQRTERKVVLVPPCMRAKPAGECEAQLTPFGSRCTACTPGCRVHQATKLGEKSGFEVLIMPHELSIFSNVKMKPTKDSAVGVVGVSCPLTNVTGGWETKDLGIPAQGLLLDYCGCSWHWHREGIPTDINFNQLLQVLDLKKQKAPLR